MRKSSLPLETASADLTDSAFNKVDCITFAVPPITLPAITCPKNNLFLTFLNEGDPVGLAQPAYINCLLDVYARAIPTELVDAEVPDPIYTTSGTCIILRDVSPDDADDVLPAAFLVDPEVLSQVLFGNPILHSMREYLDRVTTLHNQVKDKASPALQQAV